MLCQWLEQGHTNAQGSIEGLNAMGTHPLGAWSNQGVRLQRKPVETQPQPLHGPPAWPGSWEMLAPKANYSQNNNPLGVNGFTEAQRGSEAQWQFISYLCCSTTWSLTSQPKHHCIRYRSTAPTHKALRPNSLRSDILIQKSICTPTTQSSTCSQS